MMGFHSHLHRRLLRLPCQHPAHLLRCDLGRQAEGDWAKARAPNGNPGFKISESVTLTVRSSLTASLYIYQLAKEFHPPSPAALPAFQLKAVAGPKVMVS